ncbi:MAG: N-acetyltransferase [Candidatus Rokubacteria bacterium]|nr:N-acetyltransferase [Candidatus Rokubacteria bacterium]
MLEIRPETTSDAAAVRAVNDAAFGRADEGRIADALRAQHAKYFGLVAVDDDAIVGHIVFSPATLHCYSALFPIMALGPMAVSPAWQRRGIGSALVREGLAACARRGHDVVVVLGHSEFYPRFGFVPARPLGVMSEWDVPDDVFMVAELAPGALRGRRGVVYYAPEFAGATRISAPE